MPEKGCMIGRGEWRLNVPRSDNGPSSNLAKGIRFIGPASMADWEATHRHRHPRGGGDELVDTRVD